MTEPTLADLARVPGELEQLRERVAELEALVRLELTPRPRLLTVKAFAEAHCEEGWTEGSLRWLLFHRESNGYGPAVVRVGGRLRIDEQRFMEIARGKRGKREKG
jgi:hypothetical protein